MPNGTEINFHETKQTPVLFHDTSLLGDAMAAHDRTQTFSYKSKSKWEREKSSFFLFVLLKKSTSHMSCRSVSPPPPSPFKMNTGFQAVLLHQVQTACQVEPVHPTLLHSVQLDHQTPDTRMMTTDQVDLMDQGGRDDSASSASSLQQEQQGLIPDKAHHPLDEAAVMVVQAMHRFYDMLCYNFAHSFPQRKKKSFMRSSIRINTPPLNNSVDDNDKQDDLSDEATTMLLQTVQRLFDTCCCHLHEVGPFPPTKKEPKLVVVRHTPISFHVHDKWSFVAEEPAGGDPLQLLSNSIHDRAPSFEQYLMVIALQCINYRGCIAHGKRIEQSFNANNTKGHVIGTINPTTELFAQFGGTKVLTTVQDIKQELLENGPVVSLLFTPNEHHHNSFVVAPWAKTTVPGTTFPLLIVGWDVSAIGETWIVQTARTSTATGTGQHPVLGERYHRLAMGHFHIDTTCLAPVRSLHHISWQDDTIALGIPNLVAATGWYDWPAMATHLSPGRLNAFGKALGEDGLVGAAAKQIPFLVRDEKVIAQSRWATLQGVSWEETTQQWKVSLMLGK
jgi:hypothetical protein